MHVQDVHQLLDTWHQIVSETVTVADAMLSGGDTATSWET